MVIFLPRVSCSTLRLCRYRRFFSFSRCCRRLNWSMYSDWSRMSFSRVMRATSSAVYTPACLSVTHIHHSCMMRKVCTTWTFDKKNPVRMKMREGQRIHLTSEGPRDHCQCCLRHCRGLLSMSGLEPRAPVPPHLGCPRLFTEGGVQSYNPIYTYLDIGLPPL